MRLRTTVIAAAIAALPFVAVAQTATPDAATPNASPGATAPAIQARPHHDRAYWKQRRADLHAKYEKLSDADKTKFKDLSKQIRDLRHQQMQLLGMTG